jgi:hypothetical protein
LAASAVRFDAAPRYTGILLRDGLAMTCTPLEKPDGTGTTEQFWRKEQALEMCVFLFLIVPSMALSLFAVRRGQLGLGATTRSMGTAAIASSLIFSIGHGYEGTAGLATVGVMGIALALVYLWRGSLVAPMAIHFLQDFVGIVLVPVLGLK